MLNQWEKEMDLEFTPCEMMGYMDKLIAEGVTEPDESWDLKDN